MKPRAKKSYGQHFLINEPITEKISESLEFTKTYPRVLEIGPGQGVLTKYLLAKDYDFKAVDADRDMLAYISNRFEDHKEKFILNDCLKLNFYELYDGKEFLIIGNFPYNISSQIVFKILKNFSLIPEMTGMFQKEMADRIIAPHGSKTYGVISVLTQALYHTKRLFNVSPGSFNPPPKVNSTVIRLWRKEEELACDYRELRIVVKSAFSQRRKMMRNTLKSLVKNEAILKDPFFTQRPEQLSVQEFIKLTNTIYNK
jgi:16S rRNA (adenine1518-N6/adenine1519-N6)-dimethyltransferase